LDPLEKLTQVGFIKVGRWSLKLDKPCHSLVNKKDDLVNALHWGPGKPRILKIASWVR
jgi:hypothetical protein